jgi:methylmalonyl-CoA/ethylmalonyl-CoA epimerase
VVEQHKDIPLLPDGYEFHHIGYATKSLAREIDMFAFLGYHQEGELFEDPVQGVTGCFLVGNGPRIELLENLQGSSTLTPWQNAGIKMYHFAYMVANLEEALDWALKQRARITVKPVPAVAFGGRRISFVMFRNGLMLEFIESK